MEGKLYRFHRTTGTVHYIPGCCRFGDVSNPNVHADNFEECYTYEEAENTLKGSDYSVSETAALVGFNSISHFSKVYTKIIGESPKQTKKNVNSKK